MNVFLAGYRGSGKSTVGRILALRLGMEFHDCDSLIVERAGRSIAEIFAAKGEQGFRDLESDVVAELAASDGGVVALGGGALLREGNRKAIAVRAHQLIYMRCEAEELFRRIHADPGTAANRPSLTHLGGSVEEIRHLLEQREPIYRKAMTAEIDVTELTPEEAAEGIVRLVGG